MLLQLQLLLPLLLLLLPLLLLLLLLTPPLWFAIAEGVEPRQKPCTPCFIIHQDLQ